MQTLIAFGLNNGYSSLVPSQENIQMSQRTLGTLGVRKMTHFGLLGQQQTEVTGTKSSAETN